MKHALVQEMRISLIFPFVCAFVLRFRFRQGLLIAFTLFALALCLAKIRGFPDSFSQTIGYTGMFIFGILLARYWHHLESMLNMLKRPAYWAIFIFGIVLYAYIPSLLNYAGYENAAWDSFTAIGAAVIILFSLIHKPTEAWLLQRPIIYLGKISYSMYLIHAPILFAFGYLFYKKSTPTLWLIPYLATTIVLAVAMYHIVELPSIHLGKSLARKVTSNRSAK